MVSGSWKPAPADKATSSQCIFFRVEKVYYHVNQFLGQLRSGRSFHRVLYRSSVDRVGEEGETGCAVLVRLDHDKRF